MTLDRSLIGMIHVPALPGTPRAEKSVPELLEIVSSEAETLKNAGFDAILVENMHDRPYLNSAAPPEVTATLAVVAAAARSVSGLPTGVQVLAGANREALAVALAAGLDFIRAEGFVFAHVADEGLIGAGAAELLRYRRKIGAEHVKVFADIKKKHASHAITADVDIAETAKAAEFFLADGVIVTGTATGEEAPLGDLQAVNTATTLPVLVGSGVTATNIGDYLKNADAVIVGSSIKQAGRWENPIDPGRASALVEAARI